MERYLEGEEISHEETVAALKTGVTNGQLFPVTCGAATRNLGTARLLEAFVEDLPSPAKTGPVELDGLTLEPTEDADAVALVFKTMADPYAGRLNLFRVFQGVFEHDTHVHNCRAHVKERLGQLLAPQGKDSEQVDELRPGRHRSGGQAQGDPRRRRALLARPDHPSAHARAAPSGDGLRHRAEGEGRRGQGLHRAAPATGGGPQHRRAPRRADRRGDRGRPDPGARGGDRRADEGALRRRGHAEAPARALPRDDPNQRQGSRALQEADRRPRPVR